MQILILPYNKQLSVKYSSLETNMVKLVPTIIHICQHYAEGKKEREKEEGDGGK